jgi:cysteine synthase
MIGIPGLARGYVLDATGIFPQTAKTKLMRIERIILCFLMLLTAGSGWAAVVTNSIKDFESNKVAVAFPAETNIKKPQPKNSAEIKEKALRRYLVLVVGTGVAGTLMGLGFLLQEKYPPIRAIPRKHQDKRRSSIPSEFRGKRKKGARSRG